MTRHQFLNAVLGIAVAPLVVRAAGPKQESVTSGITPLENRCPNGSACFPRRCTRSCSRKPRNAGQ